jgi:type VI secretion system protein
VWSYFEENGNELLGLQKHLLQLLNTRKGSVSYLPDYGLPDLNEIYQNLPESMGDLVSEVKNLILKYETRLTNVNIIPYLSDEVNCVVYLKLQAVYLSTRQAVFFQTYFLSSGEAKIQWVD